MDEIQSAQVDTTIDISSHSTIAEKVVIAAKKNQKLSDIDGYSPWVLKPEEILDDDLHLNLLHVAAWTGDMPTIEHLMIADVNVDITTAGGFTPLHLAASRGHYKVLDSLLRWGIVDVCAVSSEGFTALHLAAFGGHYDCAEALLRMCSTNTHINAKDEVLGRTALHWAVCHPSSRKLFDLLLGTHDCEVDICARDRSGFTPLHFAVMGVTEQVLTSEQKQILLRKIGEPNLLQDDSTDEWIKDFFEDEGRRKLLSSYRSLKFSDGNLEQTILSERVVEDLPRRMVNELLKRNQDQVNAKVGNVRWFLSMYEVAEFHLQPWRKLSGIRTIHPRPRTMTGRMESTSGRTMHESMSGYSVLHFAACQDNAELVSHLLKIPDINVNDTDMIYGMTPLHCSLWAGSMRAFLRLMSFGGVDVNVGFVRRGKGPRESVLSGEFSQDEGDDGSDEENLLLPTPRCSLWPRSMKRRYSRLKTRNRGEYSVKGEDSEVFVRVEDHTEVVSQTSSDRKYLHNFLREFQSLETPLHLGIRYCPPESLWQMMITFCKHPRLDPAVCNGLGLQPLQLAWARSVFTLANQDSFPEKFVIRKELKKLTSSITKLQRIENDANLAPHEKAFTELQPAITLLEGHPRNKSLMIQMKDEETRFQNVTNIVLVAATVVAGFTFQGILQPPVMTTIRPSTYFKFVQAAFFFTNSLAFIVAVSMILICLETFAARPALHFHRLYLESHMYFAYQQRTTALLLGWSTFSGVVAYYSASILNFRDKINFSGAVYELGGIYTICFLYFVGILYSSYHLSLVLKLSPKSIRQDVMQKFR